VRDSQGPPNRGSSPLPPEAELELRVFDPDILDSPRAGQRVVRGTAVRLAGHFAGLGLALLAAPFLTRHLGVASYGTYVVVLSLIAIATIFADAGMTAVGIREYTRRDGSDRGRWLQSLVTARACAAALAGAAAVLFTLVAGYDSDVVWGTALGAVGLILTIAQQTYVIPLWAELRIELATALDLTRYALTVAGILILVASGAGLIAFFVLPIPVALVVLVATLGVVRGYGAIRPIVAREHLRYVLSEALPFAAASVLGAVFYRVAIVMMSLIGTAVETGYFSVSLRIVEVFIALPIIIVGSAFPILARAADTDRERLASAFKQLFDVSVMASALVAFALVAGAQPAIAFLGGPAFAPAVPVLRVQGCAVAVTFFVTLFVWMLWILRETRQLVVVNVAGIGLAIGLTAILVPTGEARGAAFAMLIAETFLASWLAIALLRPRPWLRPSLRTPVKTALALLAASAVCLTPFPPIVEVIVGSGVYVAVLLVFRAVPRDVWRAVFKEMHAG
jgi:O-antigen/teichoic acid export membrane protein